jgi:hypothetical protein
MSIAWNESAAYETLEFSSNPTLNDKIKFATAGLQKGVQKLILELPTEHDKELAADFIIASIKQENLGLSTRRNSVIALTYLSRYFGYKKSFDSITSADLTEYIESFLLRRLLTDSVEYILY